MLDSFIDERPGFKNDDSCSALLGSHTFEKEKMS